MPDLLNSISTGCRAGFFGNRSIQHDSRSSAALRKPNQL